MDADELSFSPRVNLYHVSKKHGSIYKALGLCFFIEERCFREKRKNKQGRKRTLRFDHQGLCPAFHRFYRWAFFRVAFFYHARFIIDDGFH